METWMLCSAAATHGLWKNNPNGLFCSCGRLRPSESQQSARVSDRPEHTSCRRLFDRTPRVTAPSGDFGELQDEGLLHLHSLSSRFESAWNSDSRPQLDDYLTDAEPTAHRQLLQLLIPIDLRCRRLRGETPEVADYAAYSSIISPADVRQLIDPDTPRDAAEFELTTDAVIEPTITGLSTSDLLQRLRSSQIVSPEVLTRFSESTSPDEVGQQLLKDGVLTAFQLQRIAAPTDLPVLLGDYVLLDQIGQGGMGTVLRAQHRRMKRLVAIKILRRSAFQDAESVQRFNREVELAAQLSHPNIVTAYDAGDCDGLQYLVTEYIDGENLADIVRDQGPFALTDALTIIRQAAAGLQYAHSKGIIHRDIKPANLLLDDEGSVKLLDVGLARVVREPDSEDSDATELTASGMIMGTISYMSPEQADNTHEANEQSDLYSLGCTLWFLLTGAPPYPHGSTMQRLLAHREATVPSLQDLAPQVPQPLNDLCQRLLAKVPGERPESAADVVEQLDELLQSPLPDLVLAAATDANIPLTATAPLATQNQLEAQEQFAAATIVADSTDDGPIHRAAAGGGSKTSVAVPLLSVLLPGIAAVALVMWWFGGEQTSPTVPQVRTPDVQVEPESNELPQLTNLTIDEVSDWRQHWADSREQQLNEQLNDIAFVLIPPGRFVPGEDEAGTVHTIDEAFYLSATEVTVGQFRAFVDATNHETVADGWGWNGAEWERRPGWGWNRPGLHEVTDQHPAASIRFTDAQSFCRWMSDFTGHTVRLPTEAEWEYACRCGRAGRWSFGNEETFGDRYAWSASQSGQQLQPVGELLPNAWGLYDMHGNESEWCTSDREDVPLRNAVVRGGGFNMPLSQCTNWSRLVQERTSPSHGAFRIVLQPE